MAFAAQYYGLAPPQVDYTTLAAQGGTVVHYINPRTREPQVTIFFDSRQQCEKARENIKAWQSSQPAE
jgi:hypothetical protein